MENKLTKRQETAIAEVAKLTGLTLHNPALAESAVKIANAIKAVTGNYYVVGVELKKVHDNKMYKDDFSDFDTFCKTIFGMDKGSAHRAMQIVNNLYTKDGKQFLETSHGYVFSDGQLNRLKNVNGTQTTPENAAEAVLAMDITPQLDGKTISERVAAWKQEHGTAGTNNRKTNKTDGGDGENVADSIDGDSVSNPTEKETVINLSSIYAGINKVINRLDSDSQRAMVNVLVNQWRDGGLIGGTGDPARDTLINEICKRIAG